MTDGQLVKLEGEDVVAKVKHVAVVGSAVPWVLMAVELPDNNRKRDAKN